MSMPSLSRRSFRREFQSVETDKTEPYTGLETSKRIPLHPIGEAK